MSYDFWMGVGAGFSLGWGACVCLWVAVQCFNRRNGYDR